MLLAIVLALSPAEGPPPATNGSVALALPAVGETSCVPQAPGQEKGRLRISCKPVLGGAALDVPFFGGAVQFNGYVRMKPVTAAGFPSPVLLAVGVTTGGSDSLFETAFLTGLDGRLVDLWPRHFRTNILDDVCIGYLGHGKPIGVAGFTFLLGEGPGEVHYSDHKYRAMLYRWGGARLSPSGSETSPERVPTWSDAAHALGFGCEGVLHTFPELDAFR
jgi:hypothetical protein